MEGGSFSTCGSRHSAARIRLSILQQLQAWRAVPFQHVTLALVPRAFVSNICNALKDSYG
eukprot:7165189-Pyramimonas_sp.AAC.1